MENVIRAYGNTVGFAKRASSCSANNIQCMNDMLKSDTTVPATGYHTECGLEDALYELGVDYDVAGNAVKPTSS